MSTIRKFFNKKNIFITGGTGTFGTAMINFLIKIQIQNQLLFFQEMK